MDESVILANLGPFLGGFGPLLGPWGRNESFSEKNFYSAQLDMKIQLAAKFQKKLMDGYRALVRTHGRTHAYTDATGNNGPSPKNRGTNKNIFCI